MKNFIKNNIVALIACAAAIVSACFVPPSLAYIDYIDFKTLASILCILAVVHALSHGGVFERIALRIIETLKTVRACVVALVLITLVGSMIMTNDVALLTFLPLSYMVLKSTTRRRILPWTFVLQNAAAILGGMILPFGNPHNLYLYGLFEIPTLEFIATMAPTFITAVVLIGVCALTVPNEPLEMITPAQSEGRDVCSDGGACVCASENAWHIWVYWAFFAVTLLFVLRVIPWYVGAAIVVVGLLIVDRRALAEVDWGLLVTFTGFFIFAGNMSNIPEVRDFLTLMLQHNALLTIVATCQVISNLPTTLLLAPFVTDWATLLVATDIAGVGTPIASLASLITLGAFMRYRREDTAYFMKMFLCVNFGLLIVLTIVAYATL